MPLQVHINEFNAVRLCILNAISSVPYSIGGKCSNVKSISIDVPCSQELFIQKFVRAVPLLYLNQENFKATVSASNLNVVFGENWSSFHYRRSSTRRRIIGLIVIHFRKKVLPVRAVDSELGYSYEMSLQQNQFVVARSQS